VEASDLYGV